MASIIKYVVDGYHDIMDNQSDQRVNDWFLMSSPFYTLSICLTYVYIVKVIGPTLMENRKPFELKNVLIVYNLFQVLFSSWLFYEFFFVLRKKNDHISTLHVIHHGIMPMSVWFGVKFSPGGHSTFFGFLNTFVHIIMYSYYFLAALGPQYQKYLWWKKYLTAIQMIQFVLVMVHAFQLLFIECSYSKLFVWWIGMHAVMFYFLFSRFYKETYNEKKSKRKAKANEISEEHSASKQNRLTSQNGNSKIGICFTGQGALYESSSNGVKQMSNGYTSSESADNLRNRVYIDQNGSKS
ncbi:unnamed protein product [Phaedon cochleariae]|uniref:Elongation of very long chain fatty acids protein n=1 Tax=Phaedon cochleariae TaxID=80249 RepID=A0A9N9SDQ7_PHACE|nr:unnamed protein product [Phaedon cochleariae]